MGLISMNFDKDCTNHIPTVTQIFKAMTPLGYIFLSVSILLAIFTFLIFLDELFYIHIKVPYKTHKDRLYWLIGIFPVFSIASFLGLCVPRSGVLVDFVASVYLSISIYQFFQLIVEYFGGKPSMLEILKNTPVPLKSPPLGCCFPCLPSVPLNKKNFLRLKAIVFQTALVRPLLIFIAAVLWTDGSYTPGQISLANAYLYLTTLTTISTLLGMYGLVIMFRMSKHWLREHHLLAKFVSIQLVLIFSNLQGSLLELFTTKNILPCVAPLYTKSRGMELNHLLLVMECFVLSVLLHHYYRKEALLGAPQFVAHTLSTSSSMNFINGSIINNKVHSLENTCLQLSYNEDEGGIENKTSYGTYGNHLDKRPSHNATMYNQSFRIEDNEATPISVPNRSNQNTIYPNGLQRSQYEFSKMRNNDKPDGIEVVRPALNKSHLPGILKSPSQSPALSEFGTQTIIEAQDLESHESSSASSPSSQRCLTAEHDDIKADDNDMARYGKDTLTTQTGQQIRDFEDEQEFSEQMNMKNNKMKVEEHKLSPTPTPTAVDILKDWLLAPARKLTLVSVLMDQQHQRELEKRAHSQAHKHKRRTKSMAVEKRISTVNIVGTGIPTTCVSSPITSSPLTPSPKTAEGMSGKRMTIHGGPTCLTTHNDKTSAMKKYVPNGLEGCENNLELIPQIPTTYLKDTP